MPPKPCSTNNLAACRCSFQKPFDCPRNSICDAINKRCVPRDHPDAKRWLNLWEDVGYHNPKPAKKPKPAAAATATPQPAAKPAAAPQPAAPDDGYLPGWPNRGPQPGEVGFNEKVRSGILRAKLVPRLSCTGEDTGNYQPQYYQIVLRWLVHPRTPINRLLVAWQLGTGKTLGMLTVLTNYIDDPRPKVLIFPTDALVTNFYSEIMKFDNPYKTWCLQHGGAVPPPPDPKDPARKPRWRHVIQPMLENAHRENHGQRQGHALSAPLRAFSYTQIGGKGLQNSPISGFGIKTNPTWSRRVDTHTLSHCIVVCDEAHNVVKPRQETMNTVQLRLVKQCGERLRTARNAVVVMFTGTPIVNDARDGDALLRLVRGAENEGQPTNEGFVSWFMDRPSQLFASTSVDIARVMPHVTMVQLQNDALQRYLKERWNIRWDGKSTQTVIDVGDDNDDEPKERQLPKIRIPANFRGVPCVRDDSSCKNTLSGYEHLGFYDKGAGKRQDVNAANAADIAPKVGAIALSIAQDPTKRKTAVILHRDHGYRILENLLSEYKISHEVLQLVPSDSKNKKKVAEENEAKLNAFNADSNRHGEQLQVLVLTAEQHSEGVTLRHVRRLILGDLSPGNVKPRWSLTQQRIGRALRMCQHEGLPPSQRRLEVEAMVLYHGLAGLPETLDYEKWQILDAERIWFTDAMQKLRDISIDAPLYVRE